uniref:rho GTPase-activating protein 17-like n=1 Tax=Myxine glutinosa TaxID=7769 RepID=UPI00358EB5A9
LLQGFANAVIGGTTRGSLNRQASWSEPPVASQVVFEACQYLEQHVGSEGIFRKCGSRVRIRELQEQIATKGAASIRGALTVDVADLLKRAVAELSTWLLPLSLYQPLYCAQMIQDTEHSTRATLLLTCLFPPHSLPTLRCLLVFLNRVASRFQENKMNAENLALVFAPSLMKGKGRGMLPARSGLPRIERDHRLKVLIILKLITYAERIGCFPKPNLQQGNPEAAPSAGLIESSISDTTSSNHKLSHNTRHRRDSYANACKQIVRGSAVEGKLDMPDALDGGAQKRKSPVASLPPQGFQKKRRSSSDEGQSSGSSSACEAVHLPLQRSGKQMTRPKCNQVIGQRRRYQKDAFGPSGMQVTSSPLFLQAPFSTSAVGELHRHPSDVASNVQQAFADSRRACDDPKSSPVGPGETHSKACAQTSATSDNSNYCIVFDESLHITSDEDENSEDGGLNECCKKLDHQESKYHDAPSGSAANASQKPLCAGVCEERPEPTSLEQSLPRKMPKEEESAANHPSVKEVSVEQKEGAVPQVSPTVQRKPSRGGARTYRNSPRRPVVPIRSMSIRAAWDL